MISVASSLADVTRLSRHPRAFPVATNLHCGGGIDQPGWVACRRPGTWHINRLWDARYWHSYCAEHAWRRIRADDHLYLRRTT